MFIHVCGLNLIGFHVHRIYFFYKDMWSSYDINRYGYHMSFLLLNVIFFYYPCFSNIRAGLVCLVISMNNREFAV